MTPFIAAKYRNLKRHRLNVIRIAPCGTFFEIELFGLGGGHVAKASIRHLDYVREAAWYAHQDYGSQTVYASSNFHDLESDRPNPNRTVRLHEYLLSDGSGLVVDHVRSQDTLDCRDANIRLVPKAFNSSRSSRAWRKSPFKGVTYVARENRWHARYSNKHIRSCRTAEEAARAYDDHVALLFDPELAVELMNFPPIRLASAC